LRAPFRMNPDWGWDDTDPHVPDTPAFLWVELDESEDLEGLVDSKGEPLFTEAPPFGFCSQQQGEST
jgi:hypothetical protein